MIELAQKVWLILSYGSIHDAVDCVTLTLRPTARMLIVSCLLLSPNSTLTHVSVLIRPRSKKGSRFTQQRVKVKRNICPDFKVRNGRNKEIRRQSIYKDGRMIIRKKIFKRISYSYLVLSMPRYSSKRLHIYFRFFVKFIEICPFQWCLH